jgi:hypothetical protein
MLTRVGASQQQQYDVHVNVSLPKLIAEADEKQVINALIIDFTVVNSLDPLTFNRLLGLMFMSGDERAGDIYRKLLLQPQMGELGDVAHNCLLMDYFPIAHTLNVGSATPEVMRVRTVEFLNTDHATRVDPARLNMVFVDFKRGGVPTSRVEELLGADAVARIPRSLYEKPSGSWWPCSLV